MRPGLKSPFLGGKIIELGKLKRKMSEISRFSLNPWVVLTLYEISAVNFEISPRKYAMKKRIFSARIYVFKRKFYVFTFLKFRILIKFFNNYEGRKCQTIVNKRKILSVFFS